MSFNCFTIVGTINIANYISTNEALDARLKLIAGKGGTFLDLLDTENANTDTFGNTADESTNKGTPTLKEPPSGRTDVQPPEDMNLQSYCKLKNIFLHAFYTLMILHFTFPYYYISCNKQRNKFKKVMKEEIKMKNRMKKLLVLATAATMMTAAFTGCGSSSDGADNNADTSADEGTSNENLNGSLSLAGSTSMEKLCEALKESFMEKNPGVTVTVEYTGSGSGIESVTAGSVDIGDSSRALTDDEKANGVEENIVAIDGIAVITDKDNSVTELTSDDLKKIYTGEISNWKDLGGKDEAIVAIGREAASGTRGAFEELLDVKDQCKYAQELDSTGAVLAKVGSTPGAIGYVSLDVLDDTVTAMKIDGVEATEENIVAGKYLLSRPFVMATKGKIDEQNDIVKAWFDYVNSDEGQAVIKKVGLILPQ